MAREPYTPRYTMRMAYKPIVPYHSRVMEKQRTDLPPEMYDSSLPFVHVGQHVLSSKQNIRCNHIYLPGTNA